MDVLKYWKTQMKHFEAECASCLSFIENLNKILKACRKTKIIQKMTLWYYTLLLEYILRATKMKSRHIFTSNHDVGLTTAQKRE